MLRPGLWFLWFLSLFFSLFSLYLLLVCLVSAIFSRVRRYLHTSCLCVLLSRSPNGSHADWCLRPMLYTIHRVRQSPSSRRSSPPSSMAPSSTRSPPRASSRSSHQTTLHSVRRHYCTLFLCFFCHLYFSRTCPASHAYAMAACSHAPRSAHASWMLIEDCDLMLWPICVASDKIPALILKGLLNPANIKVRHFPPDLFPPSLAVRGCFCAPLSTRSDRCPRQRAEHLAMSRCFLTLFVLFNLRQLCVSRSSTRSWNSTSSSARSSHAT